MRYRPEATPTGTNTATHRSWPSLHAHACGSLPLRGGCQLAAHAHAHAPPSLIAHLYTYICTCRRLSGTCTAAWGTPKPTGKGNVIAHVGLLGRRGVVLRESLRGAGRRAHRDALTACVSRLPPSTPRAHLVLAGPAGCYISQPAPRRGGRGRVGPGALAAAAHAAAPSCSWKQNTTDTAVVRRCGQTVCDDDDCARPSSSLDVHTSLVAPAHTHG